MILITQRKKNDKKIWVKIEVGKEIERRGDNIGFWNYQRRNKKILYLELYF